MLLVVLHVPVVVFIAPRDSEHSRSHRNRDHHHVRLIIHRIHISFETEENSRGLNEENLEKLVEMYNETGAAEVSAFGDKPVCQICLENPENSIVQLPCKYIFCKVCILTWLKANVTCPCCRDDVQRHFTS